MFIYMLRISFIFYISNYNLESVVAVIVW